MPLTPEQVQEWKAKAIVWPAYEGFFGNVFHRPIDFMDPGDCHPGHTHNYDHITVLGPGAWHVRATKPDGRVIERSFTVPARRFSIIHITADTEHEITSLDGDGQMGCVFATRDATGEIGEGVFTAEMTPYV